MQKSGAWRKKPSSESCGYMADDLETKGVQNSQGQGHNIGLQVGKKIDLKNMKFRKCLLSAR